MSNPKPPTSGTPHSTLEHNPLIISTRPACDATHWIPHVNQQATMRAVNFILLGIAAVFATGAVTSGTGLTQPPASGLHQWSVGWGTAPPWSPSRWTGLSRDEPRRSGTRPTLKAWLAHRSGCQCSWPAPPRPCHLHRRRRCRRHSARLGLGLGLGSTVKPYG